MPPELRAFVALPEDPSSVPSTHVGQFTTSGTSSSMGPSGFCRIHMKDHGGQKRGLEALELELAKTVIWRTWVLVTHLGSSGRAASTIHF